MKNYEIMFILDSGLEEEATNKSIEMVKEIIASDGEVTKVDVWGNRRLAYEINKKKDGYYVLVEFKANTDLPKELDRRLRINDNFMRHMIICQDED